VKSKCATTYKCNLSSCGDPLDIFEGLQNIWAEVFFGLIMIHEGISLSDQIQFKCIWVDWIGYIYAYIACYEMTFRIKFEIWFWGPRVIMLLVMRNKSRLIAQSYTQDGENLRCLWLVNGTSFSVLKSSKLRKDIFACQSKYVNDLLKNFGMKNAISIKAHMVTNGHLHLDEKEFWFKFKTCLLWLWLIQWC
jgi:hypothetical protein